MPRFVRIPNYPYGPSVLAWERPHTTPGIYAFLGLATLPRFRTQTNNLRILPRVIIDRIARFAHRDAFLASWSTGETPTVRPTSVDIGRILNASGLSPGDRMRAALTMVVLKRQTILPYPIQRAISC